MQNADARTERTASVWPMAEEISKPAFQSRRIFAGIVQRWREDQFFHIADPPVALQRLGIFRRAVAAKVVAGGIKAERIIGEMGGNEPALFGPLPA